MSEYNTVVKLLSILYSATLPCEKRAWCQGGIRPIRKISRAVETARKEPFMATIRNLTPHTVSIIGEDGALKASFPSEGIARASQVAEHAGELNGVELVTMKFGATQDLPDYQEDVYYIVSVITANAAKVEGRRADDLIITADPVRDADGRIIGCKRFALV